MTPMCPVELNQSELNRAVSRRTGETIDRIAARGFGLLVPLPPEPSAESLLARSPRRSRRRRRGRRGLSTRRQPARAA